MPVLIDSVSPPQSLKDKLYADFRSEDNFEIAYRQLLDALRSERSLLKSDIQTRQRPNPTIPQIKTDGFEDISIIGVDKQRTTQSSRAIALFNVHLQLSNKPPHERERIF